MRKKARGGFNAEQAVRLRAFRHRRAFAHPFRHAFTYAPAGLPARRLEMAESS
jgi:hypothetical protein